MVMTSSSRNIRLPVKTKFNQSVETAKQAADNPDTDDKTLGLVLTSLQEGMDELKADVNAYEILNVKRQELLTEWDESPYAEVDFPEYGKICVRSGRCL